MTPIFRSPRKAWKGSLPLSTFFACTGQELDQLLSSHDKQCDSRLHLMRGFAEFNLPHFDRAAVNFAQDLTAERVLWLHLARQRVGQDDAEEFVHNAAGQDLTLWPGPLIALHRGQASEEQVLAAAMSDDKAVARSRACAAAISLGEAAAVKNDNGTAERLLRQAKETCAPDTDYALVAEAELGRSAGIDPPGENSLLPEEVGGAIRGENPDSLTKILRQADLDPFDRMGPSTRLQ
jgi:hypothetical protein